MDEQGLNDAAIFLMSLGEEEAAEVFKHFSPKEVQKLGETIARMRNVSRDKVDQVINRFSGDAAAQSLLVSDTGNYVRAVLQARARRRQGGPADRPHPAGRRCLGHREPQVDGPAVGGRAAAQRAPADRGGDPGAPGLRAGRRRARCSCTDRQRSEVLLRVATLEGIQPTALKDLNEVLFKVLAGGDKIRKTSLGGIKAAAEIINLLGTNTESVVLESIRSYDPDLAQKIMDKMFVFDDVIKLDDRAIQTVLREVASETLIVALKGAQPELREKFLANMSSRAADALREDLESRGPMRLSEVEAQQKEILKTVRRLADEGQVVLGGGSDDSFV